MDPEIHFVIGGVADGTVVITSHAQLCMAKSFTTLKSIVPAKDDMGVLVTKDHYRQERVIADGQVIWLMVEDSLTALDALMIVLNKYVGNS